MKREIPGSSYDRKSFDKVALIDADRYKYVVTHDIFKRLQDGQSHSEELVKECIDNKLEADIFNAFNAPAYVFCFSAPTKHTFRTSIAEEKGYKANRKDKHDPYAYDQKYADMGFVYEYIKMRHPTLFFDDLEADDILSMIQHPSDTFIFSHDKDLKQVVGFHWDMDKRVLRYTDEEESIKRLVAQMITGDTVDNIPGIPGKGTKALLKFLDEADAEGCDEISLIFKCMKMYFDKYGICEGMNSFVEQWMLLSMKTGRGEYTKEKYASAFFLIEKILQNIKA